MELYTSIFTRASARKFDVNPLPPGKLKEMEAFIADVKPLLPDVKITHRIVSGGYVKGMMFPKAPHYLLLFGEGNPLRNTCAGFLYQHAVLWLYVNGYAACWLGGVKPKQNDTSFIIGMAFGKPSELAARKHNAFNRKTLSEIAEGTDSRLEAARLAPSGMNGQPWYFIVDSGAIHAYFMPSLGGLKGKFYHLTNFDIGLALCHLAVAGEQEGKTFGFTTECKNATAAPRGFTYVGTVI